MAECIDCGKPISRGKRCDDCSAARRRVVSSQWKKDNPGENARHQREHRKRKDDPK